MKKLTLIASVVLLVSLFIPIGVSAGKNENMSVAAIEIMLKELFDNDSFSTLINQRLSEVYVDHDGDVVISLETNIPGAFFVLQHDQTLEMMSAMWEAFNTMHVMFSNAGLYLYLVDGDDLVYLTDGKFIMDANLEFYPMVTGTVASTVTGKDI